VRVSTLVTSIGLVSLLIANSGHALFGPSTTDYLVRFQALRFLEAQNNAKANLETQLKNADAKATNEIEAEKQLWESQIEAARVSIQQVTQEKMRVLDSMKKTHKGNIKGIDEAIAAKNTEIENLKNPGFFTSWFSSAPTDEDMDNHQRELSHLQQDLEKLKKDPPEFAHVQPSEDMKLKIQEANDAIAKALTNLKNLGAQTKIRRLKSTVQRLKAEIKRIDDSMDCMIKLAECKEVTNRDSISKGRVCAVANLSQAKIKATNAKCTALTIDSKWSEVDDCIPEYRREILKKAGTEGLSAKFRQCRSL